MNNLKIRARARLNFTVEQADSTSVSATFLAVFEDNTITDTVDYVDGKAVFEFNAPDTSVQGTYQYQVEENFSTGSPDIYPNFDNCDGDCDFPTLEICESLESGS